MMVTLHWSMVPIGVTLLGMVAMLILSRDESDLFAGFMGAVAFLVSVAIALAIVLGHFL